MSADIQIPSVLKIGGGSFAEVMPLLSLFRCKRPLIVTDSFLIKGPLPGRLRAQILDEGLSCEIFHQTIEDPTTAIVEAGVHCFLEGGHDSLVSLGGGSCIDTAKAIGMLSANGGKARDYKVPSLIPIYGPTHIAIPTTAGTGSEVTRFTVITDTETGEKMLIAGRALLPSAAIVDYELTLTMPPRLTADTGTDALTHAIEAFVSRRANRFTDVFALAAMGTIWRELPRSVNEPLNLIAREAMMLSATQAGIAFSNASVALVHGMSRPLGAHFHVPHGLSNAMLLPSVTEFSIKAALDRYAECARSMLLAQSHHTDDAAANMLVCGLFRRNIEFQVPSLSQFGVEKERYFALIPKMVEQALESGSPQNNPRVPTADEIEKIYQRLWQ